MPLQCARTLVWVLQAEAGVPVRPRRAARAHNAMSPAAAAHAGQCYRPPSRPVREASCTAPEGLRLLPLAPPAGSRSHAVSRVCQLIKPGPWAVAATSTLERALSGHGSCAQQLLCGSLRARLRTGGWRVPRQTFDGPLAAGVDHCGVWHQRVRCFFCASAPNFPD